VPEVMFEESHRLPRCTETRGDCLAGAFVSGTDRGFCLAIRPDRRTTTRARLSTGAIALAGCRTAGGHHQRQLPPDDRSPVLHQKPPRTRAPGAVGPPHRQQATIARDVEPSQRYARRLPALDQELHRRAGRGQ